MLENPAIKISEETRNRFLKIMKSVHGYLEFIIEILA